MHDHLRLERQAGLLTVTLNRPEQRNAMTPGMTQALSMALADAAEDPAVRAVILTGAGGHFCVGGDVKSMNATSAEHPGTGARIHSLRDRMSASWYLHTMPKPTIAAIEGAAAGAGLALALACDLRICALDAKLTTAFAKVALSGDFGGSYFMSRILGTALAREHYLLSPILTGAEAKALGLVTRAVPAQEVQGLAQSLGETLATGPTLTYARMKQNLALAAGGGTLAECLHQEARNHILSMATQDHRAAAAAFVDKRPPVFSGT